MGLHGQGASPPCQGQDPDEVPEWLEETSPAIEGRAAVEEAEIHWCDETGPGPTSTRTGLCARGDPAWVEVPHTHIRMNQIATISNEGRSLPDLQGEMQRGAVITFLERLLSETNLEGLPDSGGIACRPTEAKVWADWVAGARGPTIQPLFRPWYSPELNADVVQER